MSGQYFDGLRVGDKIWTIEEGWTEVEDIVNYDNCPIKTISQSYTMDGKLYIDSKHQSAFWSDPQIVAPPRPKRKVKQVIKGVGWNQGDFTYPCGGDNLEGYWSQFVGKGLMTMTLEWEE